MTNRIRELRELAGMTQADLAEATGYSEAQISRLEGETRRLNMDAMRRISEAVKCAPEDLIAYAATLPSCPDVEAAELEGLPSVSDAIERSGMRLYRVLTNVVVDAGIALGALVVVNEAPRAVSEIKTGDVVVAMIDGTTIRILRQYVAPALLVTNRPGANVALRRDDPNAGLTVAGVVMRSA